MIGLKSKAFSARSLVLGLGLTLTTSLGCQTWIPEAGVTMPTAYYLNHPPQYIPPSPPFPLPREMRSMKEALQQPTVPELIPPGP
jgi:hypothetical protein